MLEFVVNVLGLKRITSMVNIEEQLLYYYPEINYSDIEELYKKYTKINNYVIKNLYKQYGEDKVFKKVFTQYENVFYKNAVSIDLKSAYETVSTLYLYDNSFKKEMISYLTLIDDIETHSKVLYKHLRSKIITLLLKKYNYYSYIRDVINSIVASVVVNINSKNGKVIQYNSDGIIVENSVEKEVLNEMTIPYNLAVMEDLFFFNKKKYIFKSGNNFITKGFPYSEFNYIYRILEDWMLYKKNTNDFYEEKYYRKFLIYDFVFKNSKTHNNNQVMTKEGLANSDIVSFNDIDIQYYIDYFHDNYGKLIKSIDGLIRNPMVSSYKS